MLKLNKMCKIEQALNLYKRGQNNLAQNEEDTGKCEENSELLINYGNFDKVEKQTILEKIVESWNKDNLPNPQNLRRIDRVRLKEKTKLVDEVLDSVHYRSNITEDSKLVKCGISYYPIVRDKRNKKQEERRTNLEKKN